MTISNQRRRRFVGGYNTTTLPSKVMQQSLIRTNSIRNSTTASMISNSYRSNPDLEFVSIVPTWSACPRCGCLAAPIIRCSSTPSVSSFELRCSLFFPLLLLRSAYPTMRAYSTSLQAHTSRHKDPAAEPEMELRKVRNEQIDGCNLSVSLSFLLLTCSGF